MTDVLKAKLGAMTRGARRIREAWERPGDLPFERDQDKQDIINLNLQHFLEDLADCCRHLVRVRELGWPKDNREVVSLLRQDGLIDSEIEVFLKKANGMRNIMVHRYEEVDLDIVRRVVENGLDRLYGVAQTLVRQEQARVAAQTAARKDKEPPEPEPGSSSVLPITSRSRVPVPADSTSRCS